MRLVKNFDKNTIPLLLFWGLSFFWCFSDAQLNQPNTPCNTALLGNCSECWWTDNRIDLMISCPNVTARADILLQEIEALLGDNTQIQALHISFAKLACVPVGVCSQMSLASLFLSDNELRDLPNDCLSRLKRLTTFRAANNRITRLQVCVDWRCGSALK